MYSKSTENLKLPQWEHSDHPTFLTDMNQAFKKIDDAVGPQGESLAELQNKVSLLSDLSTSQQEDIEQLRNDASDHGVQIANLQGKVAVLPEIKNQIETANANYRVLNEELDVTNERVAQLIGFMLTDKEVSITLSGNRDGRDITVDTYVFRRGALLIVSPSGENLNKIIDWFFNNTSAVDSSERRGLDPTYSFELTATADDTSVMFERLGVPDNSRKTSLINNGILVDGLSNAFGMFRASIDLNDGKLKCAFTLRGNYYVSDFTRATSFIIFNTGGSANGN